MGYGPDTAGQVQEQGIAKPVKALLKAAFSMEQNLTVPVTQSSHAGKT